MEPLLTVEQAATRLQLSVLTVRRQLARGALRGVKRGRVWRVPESALMETTVALAAVMADSSKIDSDWTQAGNAAAALYTQSFASGGELTAISDAEGGFYEIVHKASAE